MWDAVLAFLWLDQYLIRQNAVTIFGFSWLFLLRKKIFKLSCFSRYIPNNVKIIILYEGDRRVSKNHRLILCSVVTYN